jgi:hypothetical protein
LFDFLTSCVFVTFSRGDRKFVFGRVIRFEYLVF